jgi:hypothetical protein
MLPIQTEKGVLEYEPTNSFAYRFARYVVVPAIEVSPEYTSGQEFELTKLTRREMDLRLSADEQNAQYERAVSRKVQAVGFAVKWYVRHLMLNVGLITSVSRGIYKAMAEDELPETAADEMAEEEGEGAGYAYAFSFPRLVKTGERFPIKVGMTTGDVDARVTTQCRGSAIFEPPVTLWRIQCADAVAMERAIHAMLKVWGHHLENAPGTEWFNTTVEEIEKVVAFIARK